MKVPLATPCRFPRLLHLVAVMAVLLGGRGGAYGGALPFSITMGNITSLNETVPFGGTTLQVLSMLTNATESAVFHAVGLEFAGTLTIACPTDTASYAKPIVITIVNGTTQAGMSAVAHINISGVLGGMSQVSIVGGSYTFVNSNPSYFMQVTADLTITGSSTLEIVESVFTVPTSFTAWGSTAVVSVPSVTLSNNSALLVDGTTIGVYDVSVGGSIWNLFILYVLKSSIKLSNNSALSIHGTHIGVYNVSVGSWNLYVLYAASSITLSDYGALLVDGTTIGVYNVNAGSDWYLYILYAPSSITLSDNGALQVDGTTIGEINVSVGGSLNWRVLYAASITLSDNSALSMHGTHIGVYNSSVGSLTLYVLSTPSITLSDNSNLSMHDTNIGMYNVSGRSVCGLYILSAASSITLSNNSALLVNGTTIGVYNVSVGGTNWYLYILYVLNSSIKLSNNSALSLQATTVGAYNVSVRGSWWLYVLRIPGYSITLSDSSNLSLHGTTIEVYNVNVGSDWLLYLQTSSFAAVSERSTLSMHGTNIGVYNVTVGGKHDLFILSSTITLSNNSNLLVDDTTIGVYNVNVEGSLTLYVLRIPGYSITLSDNSNLSIHGTTIGVYNVRVEGSLTLYVLYASSSIALSNNNTLLVDGTTVKVNNVSVGGAYELYILRAPLTTVVTLGSTLLIVGLEAVLRGVAAGSVASSVLYGPMSVNGTVSVKYAVIDGTKASWIDSSSLSGTGHVYFINVSTAGIGDMVSVPLALANNAPTFHVCRNYVNGSLCTLSRSGRYPCATSISQRVEDCTATPSGSSTSSPTHLTRAATATIMSGTPSVSAITTASSSPTTFASPTQLLASSTTTATWSPSGTTTACPTISPSPMTATISPPTSVSKLVTTTAFVTPSLPPACPLNYSDPCPYTTYAALGPHNNFTSVDPNGCRYLQLTLPFDAWSSGDRMNISVTLATALSVFHVASAVGYASEVNAGNLLAVTQHYVLPDVGGLWVDIGLWYVGIAVRGSWSVVVNIPLLEEQFSCRLPAARVVIPLTVQLEAAPPVPDAVMKAVDAVAVASVVAPTGLIRGGMLSSLLGMMRCSGFDPDESLSFVNNPTGWAIGGSGPRYQRGSVMIVLIALFVMGGGALASVCVLATMSSKGGMGAIDLLRLPSIALPAVMLLSETGVSSAVTLVLYEPTETGDVVLGLAVLCLLVGYIVLQAVNVLGGGYGVERVNVTRQSILQYVLDPTHEVVARDERWLRRNFYFVDGRSWPLFGVVEVTLGIFSNVLEGIPLTPSQVGLCAARPACLLLMCLILLALLLWRVPNAVRLMQYIGVTVTALMCVCCAAVLANVVSPSDGAEGAATYIGLVVSATNGVLGVVEIVALLLPLVPSLSLRRRTLQAACDERWGRADEDNEMLILPTDIPTPISPKSARQLARDTKQQEDEMWIQSLIAQVHGTTADD